MNTLILCSFYIEESAIGLNCRKEFSEEALGKAFWQGCWSTRVACQNRHWKAKNLLQMMLY